MEQALEFDPDLIRRYATSGPRYTSYPTALQFRDTFGEADYRRCAAASNRAGSQAPLSLYFHIPFCDTVCFYCACNRIITRNRRHAAPYLAQLHQEIALQSGLFDRDRPVVQLHWGGGTPTFISHAQMRELMRVTGEHFHLLDDDRGEYSIEIDPREANAQTIAVLRDIGFNRISLGVQDFDPPVQILVNRIQSEAQTRAVLDAARHAGFRSTNVDLIYGLPHQSVASFSATLDKVIDMDPARLSVFNYAHLPQMFKTQRQIREADLPSAAEKLAILGHTIERLTGAGYVFIGMDHFAKPDDELAVAQRGGTLHRNFQGYSTHADCDLVAMGATAISRVGDSYSQNLKMLDAYRTRLDSGRLPVYRGVALSADDRLRRDVINRLICGFALDFDAVARAHGIDFQDCFAAELANLAPFQADGLIELDSAGIRVRPRGRLLIRNLCMVFDRYLEACPGGPDEPGGARYSRVI